MKCKKCGHDMYDDSNFCSCCGEKIDTIRCAICGKENAENADFCGGCGVSLVKTQNKKSKSIAPVCIIAAILAVVCVAAFVVRGGFKDKRNTATVGKNETEELVSAEKQNNIEAPEKNSEDTMVNTDIGTEKNQSDIGEIYTNEENIDFEKDYGLPVFEKISATSVLSSIDGNNYSPYNLFDNNNATAWVEGVEGNGIGEKIEFYASQERKVSGLCILNGYCKSDDIYMKNNRVKSIEISFSDGTTIIKELSDMYMIPEVITFDRPVVCTAFSIRILDVYNGTKYEDTCISDIEIF